MGILFAPCRVDRCATRYLRSVVPPARISLAFQELGRLAGSVWPVALKPEDDRRGRPERIPVGDPDPDRSRRLWHPLGRKAGVGIGGFQAADLSTDFHW